MNPALAAPADRFHTKAPIGVAAATAPTFATTNADPAITEATSYAGLDFATRDRPRPASRPTRGWPSGRSTWFRSSTRRSASATARAPRSRPPTCSTSSVSATFYNPGEVAFFDPHVIYDSLHQRWVAIEASFDCFTDATTSVGTGYLDIAISDGPDPTLGWGVLSIGYTDALPDYPGIGTSTDKVVVSANVFELAADASPMGCGPIDGPSSAPRWTWWPGTS